MRRVTTTVMTVAIFAAVIGVVGAGAHDRCTPETTYRYCGEHVRYSKLPMTFKLNDYGRPSSVKASEMRAAVVSSAATWSRAFIAVNASGNNTSAKLGDCAAICFVDTATSASLGLDGQNTILWGDPSSCGGHPDAVAVACLWYEGSSGDARHRIQEVDIVLNTAKSWKVPQAAADLIVGELVGSMSGIREHLPASWYDVQSALTHELGHALGLEDIGHPTKPWPADIIDGPKHYQTMYRWYFPGSTNKRTLADGDIAGLMHAAADSSRDK